MTEEFDSKIQELVLERQRLLDDLRLNPSGLDWCLRHTQIADQAVAAIYSDLTMRHQVSDSVSLIATGGYGRSELAPFSDIDITVLPRDESSATLDSLIRDLFQALHEVFSDRFGLKVGYSYRLISDAPGLDATSRTGLMDLRHVVGSREMTRRLANAMSDTLSAGEFVLSKTTERNNMFAKFHDTPLVVEPQLKEGAGGLRCFHCSNWIREAIGEHGQRPGLAYDKVTKFRNLLHLESGKTQDLFTRAKQAKVAEAHGLDLYEMMSDLSEAALELNAGYRRATEKLHEARYRLAVGCMAVQGEARPIGNPDGGHMAVGLSVATALNLRVPDLTVPSPASVNGPACIYAISTGEATIRNMDRCGLLTHVLPELTRCRFLMPSDNVHQFTVMEHSLRAVRNLEEIANSSFLGEIRDSVNDMEPLMLAALLHDVGKAEDEPNHSAVGARIVSGICERWGLAKSVQETVDWLIREHLTMSKFIRVRDIMNPLTAQEFSEIVGNEDRLNMLTLLTAADTMAVGEGTWTSAQEIFMRELHSRTMEVLHSNQPVVADPALHRQRLLRRLKSKAGDEVALQEFINSLPAYYLTSTPHELIRLHLEFAQRAIAGETIVETYQRADIKASDVTICTLDSPGLLNQMLGILYAFDLSVSEIRACTTTSSPAVALDVFTVSFGGRPIPPATLTQLSATLERVMKHQESAEEVLRSKGKDPWRRQNVFSYSFVPGSPGILEIHAPRGRGMAYRFTRLILQNNWNLLAARVGQWAGNATAAFYVQNKDGSPLDPSEVQDALTEVTP